MQRETFSRARKILGIRILPRAPTLQTYLFWPIGLNQPRELAQYSSDSRFFWSSCNATSHIFTCAKKKKDPIWLPEIRLLHLGLSQRALLLRRSTPLRWRARRRAARAASCSATTPPSSCDSGASRRERRCATTPCVPAAVPAPPASASSPRRVLPQRRSAGAPRCVFY